MKLIERFLHYVSYDTQSDPKSTTYPSTEKQKRLGEALVSELQNLGVLASMDEFGYVIGRIASNTTQKVPTIALIAHMDTSPDASGKDIKPRIIKQYDGGAIVLNQEQQICLDPTVFPSLLRHIGSDLIVTDGTTLLGADDKLGIAIIMSLVETLQTSPDLIHGEVVVVFTPDEEVGRGTDHLDMKKVNADFGYTLDGSRVGEIAYENFNAAKAVLHFHGKSVHPGSAKNKMVNALRLAMEFDQLLPLQDRPELTEGYEGFNHLHDLSGITEKATAEYIIRNHDAGLFEKQKDDFRKAVSFLNQKYGYLCVDCVITNSYFNMKEALKDHMQIVEAAKQAIRHHGIEPYIEPIRGGTDGARLTYMGLPCPNLGTGGYSFHGPFEYVSIQEALAAFAIVKTLICSFAKSN